MQNHLRVLTSTMHIDYSLWIACRNDTEKGAAQAAHLENVSASKSVKIQFQIDSHLLRRTSASKLKMLIPLSEN